MIEFILNNEHIVTHLPSGSILLDFIRNEKNLSGTKIGCREGDCGACTVLMGEINETGEMSYKAVTSCLTPLGNAHNKHIVTIEGISPGDKLTPIQKTFVENNATQCGFCTPGFIVSLTGYALDQKSKITGVKEAVSGNICRCTGYNSIKKAGDKIAKYIFETASAGNISKLIDVDILPEYFAEIPNRLKLFKEEITYESNGKLVGGGTDIFVSQFDETEDTSVRLLSSVVGNNIIVNSNECIIEAGATATDIQKNSDLQKIFPELHEDFNLISSQQIRNMGTVGGNIVNASPIADLAIFFLALDSKILIADESGAKREILLRDFYKGYKTIDLHNSEIIKEIRFNKPDNDSYFSFEKVSKRKHLDIASVNSAMKIKVQAGKIFDISISAGGIAPVPLYLKNTSNFLRGKSLNADMIKKAHCVLKEEIAPISDIRGSEIYKRLLIRQLYYAHFIKLFPDLININNLTDK